MAIVSFAQSVHIPADPATLDGGLVLPQGAEAIVIFAHGSGSSRHSPRNRLVAEAPQEEGLGTLLFDLLTREEDAIYENRFNIPLLIVGSRDHFVIELNRDAYKRITAVKELKIIAGASHLFEEPGALEQVAFLASDWFVRHLLNIENKSAA